MTQTDERLIQRSQRKRPGVFLTGRQALRAFLIMFALSAAVAFFVYLMVAGAIAAIGKAFGL